MIDFFTVITAVALPTGGAALTLAGKWILSGQKDIKDLINTNNTLLDIRVKELENKTETFMSKDDLRLAFNHEAEGRKAIKEAADYLIRKNADDIMTLREHVARLDQNDINMTQRLDQFSSQVDKRFDRVDSTQEDIRKCLAEINKKV